MLAVTGMTPQVITETIYALKTERDIVPDEVHVVTTSSGADCIRETLLDPSCGRWQDFVSALGADKTISFNAANVHVIRTADGRKLDDIRTPEDNIINPITK